MELLNSLKSNPKNPRTIKKDAFEKLKKSLKEFPQMLELRPIVYDDNNVVLGGNMRLKALQELAKEGMEIKDSWFKKASDLTEDQKREFIIKDNVPFGEWDDDALANEWSDLPLDEWGIDTSGWKSDEVIEDEAPEVSQEEPKSKLGEVYQLGRHRLMCGDSTKIEDVEKLMNGQKADMVFTDPPYELNTFGGGIYKNDKVRSQKQIREQGIDTFDPLRLTLFAKTNIFFCNKALIPQYIKLASINQKAWDLAVYHKRNTVPNYSGHLMSDVEYQIIIGELEPETEYLTLVGLLNPNTGYKKDLYSKVFYGEKDKRVGESYSKPIAICAKFIRLYSNKDQIVLDLFGGSGSTLIACEQLNRTCYMMELDPKYVDVIRKRYAKFIGKEAEWQTITLAM